MATQTRMTITDHTADDGFVERVMYASWLNNVEQAEEGAVIYDVPPTGFDRSRPLPSTPLEEISL